MPLFGKKKDKDGAALNLDNLSLENDDDDDDNDEWDDDDDEENEEDEEDEDNLLKEALGGLDDLDDLNDDEDGDDSASAEKSEDEEELSPDLLDIFTSEEETDIDLAALTTGLEDVEASSLLTQARQIAAAFRGLTQSPT